MTITSMTIRIDYRWSAQNGTHGSYCIPTLALLRLCHRARSRRAQDSTLAGSFPAGQQFSGQSLDIVIGGLAVASGLSFWATVVTSALGILIAFTAYIIMATVGVDYGITGQVACRMVFGIQGAKWLPSVMRTIASAYWFAVQTIVGATVIVAIAHQWTGRHIPSCAPDCFWPVQVFWRWLVITG